MTLTDARYMSLATFRRSGEEVRTPVWFAEEAGTYYVVSAGDAGKVKRLRNGSRARVASCDAVGNIKGEWHDARAVLIEDATEIARAHAALRRKYGWQFWGLDFLATLSGRIKRRAWVAVTLENP